MILELEIWRAANLVIQHYGENAEIQAAQRADLILERGDGDGQNLWMRITRAIVALQAPRGSVALGSGLITSRTV